jgi:DNA-binding CsgD family transcriptional regulator/PAS domain-containing protein
MADDGAAGFSRIVGDIYDCVLEPLRWPATLARLASLVHSTASSIVINDAGDPHGGHIFEHGGDQKYLRLFFERHAAADHRPIAVQRNTIGVAKTLEMLCSDDWSRQFHQDLILPQGFGDLITIQVLRSGTRAGWLSTARSLVQSRYGAAEKRVMGMLSPHLCQALAVSDAINLVALTSHRLEQTVDALSVGVFLTDGAGQVVYTNRSAERQLRTGNALQVIDRRLMARDHGTNAALARVLTAKTCTDAIASPTGRLLALPDGVGNGYLASVLPLDGGHRQALMAPFRASAGVFVQDPSAPSLTLGEAFAELYGLTSAELKVLLALAPGLTAREAALALGIREPTIKTHLQRIYAKTGMSGQSEAIRLLLAHAPPLRQR